MDDVFRALANDKRRNMLVELAYSPASISALAQKFGLSLPAIHKHITVLVGAQLVFQRKQGRTNYLVLNPSMLAPVQQWTAQFHTAWGSTEATLENYFAGMQEDAESD